MDSELIARMKNGTRRQAGGKTVKELERLRDDCLIAIMQALSRFETAAGRTLAEDEARRKMVEGS